MAAIPDDFLRSPASKATVQRIDFSKSALPCYSGCYAAIIDNVLSPQECTQLLEYAEQASGWERAMINVGGGMQLMNENTRKCSRIIWDQQSIVDRIWARCQSLVPEMQILNSESWPQLVDKKRSKAGGYRLSRVNERMRILKYSGGEYFKPHFDGQYVTPDGTEKSFFTIHVYLNDANHQPDDQKLVGGATTFWDITMRPGVRLDVDPKVGSVLIFQHAELLHSGDDLISGIKFTLRSDVMYVANA